MTDLTGNEDWIADHGRFLRRIAGALLTDPSDAEDAVQDAWVQALEADMPRNPGGWLVDVTRRMAARARRGGARRSAREREAARPERQPAADAVAARAEIVRRVASAVSDVPEPFRETLLLRFYEGLPPRAIAERLGVPVATVQSRTRRGLARVRAALAGSDDESSRSWRSSLALASGLDGPGTAPGGWTPLAPLGALTMKSKTLLVCAAALVLLATAPVVAPLLERERTAEIQDVDTRLAEVAEPSDDPAPVPADRTTRTAPTTPDEPPPVAEAIVQAVRVLDPFGEPVPGAAVLSGEGLSFMRLVAETDDDGRAEFPREGGIRNLVAEAPGWARSAVKNVPMAASVNEPIVLQFTLRGVPLEVAVLDAAGAPLADALVLAGRDEAIEVRLPDGGRARTAPPAVARTGPDGVARYAGLSPGWLRVRVEHEDHAPATAFATLEPGANERVEVWLQPSLTVIGRVTDATGAPVACAVVRQGNARRETTTDADGRYRLGPIGAGKIVATGPAGRTAQTRPGGDASGELRWDPVLDEEPLVEGRVVDATGSPLADWRVHANDDTHPGWRRGVSADSDGRFRIYGDRRAALRIEATPPGAGPIPHAVLDGVAPGSRDVLLQVAGPADGVVTAQLTRDDGGEVDALPLFLRRVTRPDRERLTGGPGRESRPEAEGAWRADGVPPGRFELLLRGEPFGWYQLAVFDVDAGAETNLGAIAVPEPGTLETKTWWGGDEPYGDVLYQLERRADNVRVATFRGTFPETMPLAPGVYTLQTEVTPGPQRTLEFEIRAGQTTSIDLDLRGTSEHEVVVRYASGRPAAGDVQLVVRRTDDDDLEVARDSISADGKGTWRRTVELGAGLFEFVARDAQGRTGRTVESRHNAIPGTEIVVVIEDD